MSARRPPRERRLLIIRQDLRDRRSVARRRLGITGQYGVAGPFTPAAAPHVSQQVGPPARHGQVPLLVLAAPAQLQVATAEA